MEPAGLRPSGAAGEAAAPLAVVAALPEELAILRRRARASRVGAASADLWAGAIGGRQVILGRGGEGAQKAARGLDRLLSLRHAELLIGTGVAAGLSQDLARGDVLVAREVRDDRGPAPPPDPRWTERALALGAKGGVLLTSRGILATREAKAAALLPLQPGTTAAADMESAAWARMAAQRGVPYLVVRAISDAAADELPPWLASCVDAEGGVSRARVIGKAVFRPSALGALLRLRSHVTRGVQQLADFLERLLGPSGPESAVP